MQGALLFSGPSNATFRATLGASGVNTNPTNVALAAPYDASDASMDDHLVRVLTEISVQNLSDGMAASASITALMSLESVKPLLP